MIWVLQFDFLKIFEALNINFIDDSVEAHGFNENFEALGYDSSSTTDNLGTLNFFMGLLILRVLVFFGNQFSLCRKSFDCRQLNRDMTGNKLSAACLRFLIETYLEFLTCTLVAIIPGEYPNLFEHVWGELSAYDRFSKV